MRTRIYSLFLALYPAELRNAFGAEMIQVFGEDLEDSYRTRGFPGAARVWYRSLKELFHVALPARAAEREISVAVIMYVLQEVYFFGILMLAGRGTSDVPTSHGSGIFEVMVWGLFPAFIAFVAVRVGNRALPVPLDLRRR
jgi:hypothetical protein